MKRGTDCGFGFSVPVRGLAPARSGIVSLRNTRHFFVIYVTSDSNDGTTRGGNQYKPTIVHHADIQDNGRDCDTSDSDGDASEAMNTSIMPKQRVVLRQDVSGLPPRGAKRKFAFRLMLGDCCCASSNGEETRASLSARTRPEASASFLFSSYILLNDNSRGWPSKRPAKASAARKL